MTNENLIIESFKPFSESMLWQLSYDYYHDKGIEAWRSGEVPHHLTSNATIGRFYAAMIFSYLKDIHKVNDTDTPVYILELGAGHGRLAFHILKHLVAFVESHNTPLPKFTYILSDIASKNLDYFSTHPQLLEYIDQGVLDVAYFNATSTTEIELRHSKKTLKQGDVDQYMLSIANYFFDSLPNDLYELSDGSVNSIEVSLQTKKDLESIPDKPRLNDLETVYRRASISTETPLDDHVIDLLNEYSKVLDQGNLMLPTTSIQCLQNIQKISTKGLLLLSMDKGYHDLESIRKLPLPDMVAHGSVSFQVNFHALAHYCKIQRGETIFAELSNFNIEVVCMLFCDDKDVFKLTKNEFHKEVDKYGPDDYLTLKRLLYSLIPTLTLQQILSFLRLSNYDSTIAKNCLNRVKQLIPTITHEERVKLKECFSLVWNSYFRRLDKDDMAFEFGGILYQLAYYEEAISFFDHSVEVFGHTPDELFNRSLCHYQLHQDELFKASLATLIAEYPDYPQIADLQKLDLTA